MLYLGLFYAGVVVYALIDCLQTPANHVLRLSRGQWLAVIGLLPLFGAVSWLLLGRIPASRADEPDAALGPLFPGSDREPPIGPDDDPEFLAGLGRAQRERNRLKTRQEKPDEPGEDDPQPS